MKKLLLLFIVLTPLSTFASWYFSKEEACSLKDGVYENDLQVNYPGYTTQVFNFVKSNKKITYVVNSWIDNSYPISKSVYEYSCVTKKAALVNDLTDHNTYGWFEYAEVDYQDTNYLVIRFKQKDGNYEWYNVSEGIIDRKTKKFREFVWL